MEMYLNKEDEKRGIILEDRLNTVDDVMSLLGDSMKAIGSLGDKGDYLTKVKENIRVMITEINSQHTKWWLELGDLKIQ